LAAALLLSACAGTPTSPEPGFSEEALRDVDHDLIFATEFPVASKAEAIARADAARSEGELDRALFFYVKALKFDSQDARLLAAIGFLHQFQGNAEYAVRAYTLALKEDPDFAEVLEARGLMLLSNHEDERARIDLTRAVSFNMSAWRSYNGLGLLADRQGNHSLAVTYYDNALAANPGEANILNNRGYSKILVEDFDGAYRDLREATEVHGHQQAWVNLGTLHARQGNYEQAVVALQEVLSHPEALNKVAEASILNGDNATAERLLKRAIKLSPRYFPAAENNLAQLQLQSDNI
jgi:tetratricopeptide (TPR) repeat protein